MSRSDRAFDESCHCTRALSWAPGALALVVGSALLLTSAAVFAQTLPGGAKVVSGNVTVTQPNGQQLVVNQGSSSAIINWQSFSIGYGNNVTFVQPNASSVALNRVVGGSPSSIFGSLTATGKVFLVNPAGVLFAPGASVNTGSFVASTLGISDSDFLAGRYTFQNDGSAGSIVNQGAVNARDGAVVFIAPQIVNAGNVSATGGVALAAGDRVSMTLDAESPLSVSVDASALKASITHSGTIFSGGPVLLSAQTRDSALDTVINSSGVIRARSISSNGEDIQLNGGAQGIVSISGTLDASGAGASGHGGNIAVSGDQLALAGTAKLDASGAVGGGTILVGGAAHGAGPLQNASTTTIEKGAVLDASAMDQGNGGQVVVWSNDRTQFSGAIASRGGANGGNGGNAEISSKGAFVVDGSVDLSALHGQRGTLLLDPFDLCIVSTDPGTCGTLASGSGTYTAGANDSYVLTSTLVGLSSTTNLVLQATNSIIFMADLALNATTTPSSQGSISLEATNAILMNGHSLSTDGGNISMLAGAGGISLGNLSSGTGAISLGLTNASGTITQASGSSISGSGGLTLSGGIVELSQGNTYSGGTNVTDGTLVLTGNGAAGASTGAITVGSGAALNVQNILGNGVALNGGTLETTTGSGTVNGQVTLNGSNTFSTGSNATLTVSGAVIDGSSAGVLTVNGAGTVTLTRTNTFSGGTTINGGTLAVTSIAGASTGAITVDSGAALDVQNTLANAVTLNGGTLETTTGAGTVSGTVALSSSGTFATGSGATLTVSGTVSGGASPNALTVGGPGTVVLSGGNTYTGGTLVSGGTLQGNTQSLRGSITNNASLVFDQATNDTFSGTIGGTGAVTKQNTGTLTFDTTQNYGGGTSVTGGTLALTGGGMAGTSAITVGSGAALDVQNTLANAVTLNGGTLETTTRTGTVSGTVALSNSGTFATGSGATLTVSGAVSGGASPDALTVSGPGTVVLGGVNTYTGGTLVSGGTLQGNTQSLRGSITNNASLVFDQASNGTFSGTIGGTGAVTKQNTGTLTFDTTQNYGGGTSVTGGTLALAGNGTAGTSAISVGSGAALDVQNTLANAVALTGGTLETTTGTGIVNGLVTLNGSNAFSTGSNATLTVNSVIADGTPAGALTVSGAGTVVLTGINTFSGGTTINGGTLAVTGTGTAGASTGAITVGSGAALDVRNTIANALTLTGGGTLETTTGSGIANGVVTLNGSNTFATGNNATLTVSGAVVDGTPAGALIVNGTGTVVLTGVNTYSGSTLVSGGTLQGNTQSLQGSITNNASLVFDQASNGTFSGTIGGTGAVTKKNTGTLTFDTTQNYGGGTSVTGGTLALTGGGMAGTSAITVGSGAALDVQDTLANAVTLNGGTLETTTGAGTVSGTVALSGSGTFATGSGATLTVSGAVSGGASPTALTVSGPGTVVLGGVNTYSGGTLVSGGTLQGNTQSLQGSITNNASLVFDQASNGTFSGTIGGTGAVTKQNTGTLTFDTTQNYGGGTSVTGGTLALAGNGTAGTSAISIGSGAALDVQNTLANAVALTGGTLETTTGTGIVSGLVTLNGSNAFSTGSNATLTVNSVIADGTPAGALTVSGAGTVVLTGMNTFSGGTTINGGTLALTGTGTAGASTGAITVGSGAALDVRNTLANALTLTGGGTLETTTGSGIANGGVTLNGSNTFATGSGARLTVNGVIGDGTSKGLLTVSGPGTVVLTGLNTYSGGTAVAGGTLQGNATSLQGHIGLASATSLVFDQAANGTFNGSISGAGAVTKQSAGTLTLNGAQSYSGGTTVTGGALQGNTTSLQGDFALAGGTGLVFDQASNGTFNGKISGAGAVTKQNGGTLTIGTDQTYTGGTSVTNGTLTLTGNGTAGASAGALTVSSGAALDVQNTLANAVTLNGGTLETSTGSGIVNGAVTLDGSSLFATGSNAALTINGALGNGASAGALVVGGAGLVTLNGVSSFTGGTSVTGGTLQGNTASLNGNIALAGGTRLVFDQASNSTFDGAISGGGAVSKQNTGTLSFDTAQTYTGGTAVTAGTLALKNSGTAGASTGAITVGSGASLDLQNTLANALTLAGGTLETTTGNGVANGLITLSGGSTISAASSATLTVNGVIRDGGTGQSLNKQGAGLVTLNGADSYTGGTSIIQGTLAVGAGGSLGSGLATVNGGATLALAGATLGNNVSLLDGSTLVASGGLDTLSGALNVRGATFDIGAGSTLNAANAFNHFTGATTFTGGGSLALSADTGGIQLGTTTLANLKLQSDGAVTQSAAATITGTTSIATTGGAAITLNQANQFGNALQLSGGPASVNSAAALNFGASNVASLNASAGGDITQTGALQVSGATTLSTPNGNLILDLDNTFGALVTARAAGGSLKSAQDLALALSTPGTMNVTAGGALTVSGTAGTLSTTSGGATTFGATLIGDALTVVAGGPVTTASGASVSANSITLTSKATQNIGAARPGEFALNNVGKLSLVSGFDAFFLLPNGQQTRFSIGTKVNCARVNMGPCLGNNVLISAISSVQAGIQSAMVNQMHQEDEFTLKVKYGFAGDLAQVQTYPHEGDLEVRQPAPCRLADHAVAEPRDESVRLRAAEVCP
ncbi:beta strand repeat-containing protein [Paraburkholderia lacunae]|uniref:beta strand repeat-containing protein n=1 Tax=Paraburkholderia lacunae TaxID=2211104 RepID=UPI001403EE11|nr:autotransporter-associated beta strand repeat-containing protein [Paraburkholderia lacunae]